MDQLFQKGKKIIAMECLIFCSCLAIFLVMLGALQGYYHFFSLSAYTNYEVALKDSYELLPKMAKERNPHGDLIHLNRLTKDNLSKFSDEELIALDSYIKLKTAPIYRPRNRSTDHAFVISFVLFAIINLILILKWSIKVIRESTHT